MNTSLSWIKAYVPELDVTATGVHRCDDPVRFQGGRIYKNGCDLEKIVSVRSRRSRSIRMQIS